jgi:hypothetical protein
VEVLVLLATAGEALAKIRLAGDIVQHPVRVGDSRERELERAEGHLPGDRLKPPAEPRQEPLAEAGGLRGHGQ